MTDAAREAAEALWDYHRLGESITAAEGILVFGSNDLRVAEHAASLFHEGLAPWLLFSGERGRMTQAWPETEAETMARVAITAGVPESAILIENRATNTGENIRFSRTLLEGRGLHPVSAIFVQKPYMERRTRAALDVQWPGMKIQLSSPPLDFTAYCSGDLTKETVIAAMVGDFQRIVDYPALGFASPQPVPAEARAAFDFLVAAGFREQLR
jgi:uncharacterized SAM-binding protein YcdF (DUF218 family)